MYMQKIYSFACVHYYRYCKSVEGRDNTCRLDCAIKKGKGLEDHVPNVHIDFMLVVKSNLISSRVSLCNGV